MSSDRTHLPAAIADLQAAAGRRTAPLDLDWQLEPDGETIRAVFRKGRLLTSDENADGVLQALAEVGVRVVGRVQRLTGVVEFEIAEPVAEVIQQLRTARPDLLVTFCHVATIAAHRVSDAGRQAQTGGPIIPRPADPSAGSRVVMLGPVESDGEQADLLASLVGTIARSDLRTTLMTTGVFDDGIADEVEIAAALIDSVREQRADIVVVPGGWYVADAAPSVPLTIAWGSLEPTDADRHWVVVAAAGDNETERPLLPAAYGSCLSVAALEPGPKAQPASWSNWGADVDAWAVGEHGQDGWAGTAISAAVVAGAIAAEFSGSGDSGRLAADRRLSVSHDLPGLGTAVAPANPDVLGPGEREAQWSFDIDPSNPDSDADGLSDLLESDIGFHLSNPDSDADSLSEIVDWPDIVDRPDIAGRPDMPDIMDQPDRAAAEDTLGDAQPADQSELAAERTVFPFIGAPDEVLVLQEFEIDIGLGDQASRETAGTPSSIIFARGQSLVGVDIHLIADGFTLATDETWRNTVQVPRSGPAGSVVLHLTAQAQDQRVRGTQLQVTYSIGGNTLAWAARGIAVVDRADLLGNTGFVPDEFGTELDLARPPADVDLTVNITQGGGIGQFNWTFATKYADVPDKACEINLGADAEKFAEGLVLQVKRYEGKGSMANLLLGKADEITEKVPSEFWDLLAEVACKVDGRPPTVLLQSAEPFVPWELALVPTPLSADYPPFLGCQAVVGRWVVTKKKSSLKPPDTAGADTMSVISGIYDLPRIKRLEAAEAEAKFLATEYGAVEVTARLDDVVACLEQDPSAQIVHFAGHGSVSRTGLQNGLILIDGTTLEPAVVRGTPFHGRPLVFLNACQVGGGEEVLGNYAGMAAAFLQSGASAVVAPLWDVDDTIAKALVEKFYERCFAGEKPAEVIRSMRSTVAADGKFGTGHTVATALAYQYFGHPDLVLNRTTPDHLSDPGTPAVTQLGDGS